MFPHFKLATTVERHLGGEQFSQGAMAHCPDILAPNVIDADCLAFDSRSDLVPRWIFRQHRANSLGLDRAPN